jgi:hypothetical protein
MAWPRQQIYLRKETIRDKRWPTRSINEPRLMFSENIIARYQKTEAKIANN